MPKRQLRARAESTTKRRRGRPAGSRKPANVVQPRPSHSDYESDNEAMRNEAENESPPQQDANIPEVPQAAGDAAQSPDISQSMDKDPEPIAEEAAAIEETAAEPKMKVATWNVAGLRAMLKKDKLRELLDMQPDVVCLQEVKATMKELPEDVVKNDAYFKYWLDSASKKGYAGCALWSKQEPLNVIYGIEDERHDEEGRAITAEFEHAFVVCVYVPNAGRKLVNLERRLQWNVAFAAYIGKLDKVKPVLIAGDMNVAHQEIDLKNPKANAKNAGFSQQERDGMSSFLEMGFADVYRHHHPDETDCYTFWAYMGGARAKNIGWRLDYFIASQRLVEQSMDCLNVKNITGSDHCPVVLHLNKPL